MENENEVIEDLFVTEPVVEENMEENVSIMDAPLVSPNLENVDSVEEVSAAVVEPEPVNNVFADLPPVAPVDYEENEVVNESPVPEMKEEIVQEADKSEEKTEYVAKEVLEHPDAKITLQREEEKEIDKKELKELETVSLKDNDSLKFVLILGLIFLIAILLIPTISNYIS